MRQGEGLTDKPRLGLTLKQQVEREDWRCSVRLWEDQLGDNFENGLGHSGRRRE